MPLTLYSHPFSSYCQKVLIALWKNDIPFAYRHLEEPGAAEERASLWPFGRFPVLVDDGKMVAESSIIIEHLDLHHPGPVRLLPDARSGPGGPIHGSRLRQLHHDAHAEACFGGAECRRARARRKRWRRPATRSIRPMPGWRRD